MGVAHLDQPLTLMRMSHATAGRPLMNRLDVVGQEKEEGEEKEGVVCHLESAVGLRGRGGAPQRRDREELDKIYAKWVAVIE